MGPGVDLHRRDNLPAAGDMPAGGELQIAAYASPQHREEHRVRSSAHTDAETVSSIYSI